MTPCLVYMILGIKKVGWLIRVFVSTLPAFHLIFVQYSAFVFLDMLGTFLALMALLFYLLGHNRIYSAVLFLALMTKEYFAIFALSMLASSLLRRHSIHKPTAIALGLFGAWCLHYFVTGPPTFLLYVHSSNLLDLNGLSIMFVNLFFVPVIVLSARKANLEFLTVSAIYPFFLYLWGTAEAWYLLLPIAINSCLIALALDQITKSNWSILSSRIWNKMKYLSTTLVVILLVFSICCQIVATNNFMQTYHYHDVQEATDFLKTRYDNQDIMMIDCFWAISTYPLGEFMHIRDECWSGQESLESLRSKIGQVGLCILGKADATSNLVLRESFKDSVVFENIGFIIISTTTLDERAR